MLAKACLVAAATYLAKPRYQLTAVAAYLAKPLFAGLGLSRKRRGALLAVGEVAW